MIKRWTPVLVEWDDAHGGDTGWGEPDPKAHKPERVRTVGMLYKHDERGITVYSSRTAGGHVGGYSFVPTAMVVSVKPLA
jgi:hypothetical protein